MPARLPIGSTSLTYPRDGAPLGVVHRRPPAPERLLHDDAEVPICYMAQYSRKATVTSIDCSDSSSSSSTAATVISSPRLSAATSSAPSSIRHSAIHANYRPPAGIRPTLDHGSARTCGRRFCDVHPCAVTDWHAWHEEYADPDSSLSRRLTVVSRGNGRVLGSPWLLEHAGRRRAASVARVGGLALALTVGAGDADRGS